MALNLKEKTMEFVEGKVVELDGMEGQYLAGARVRMIRRSRKTSNITVEMVEKFEAYEAGERLHVQLYQLRECVKRPAELARNYVGAIEHTERRLQVMIEEGKASRLAIAEKITRDSFESLAYEFSWGHGVREDILMGLAAEVLDIASRGSMLDALLWMKHNCEAKLLRNSHSGQSSSEYRNAVDATRNKCLAEFSQFCKDRAEWIAEARAEMEVL